MNIITNKNIVEMDDIWSVLFIGAHPDDIEIKAGGLLSMFLVSNKKVDCHVLTPGGLGFYSEIDPVKVSRIRQVEQQKSGKVLGVEFRVGHEYDSKVYPSEKLRRSVIAMIRRCKPDLVVTHRIFDYHPDHRAVGQVVIDALPFLDKPNIAKHEPVIKRPELWFFYDEMRPDFIPDKALNIGTVIQKKQDAINAHVSQRQDRYSEDYPKQEASRISELFALGIDYAEVFERYRY